MTGDFPGIVWGAARLPDISVFSFFQNSTMSNSAVRFSYPATPVNVPASATQVSPGFRREVKSVLGMIVLFFIVYLLLLTFGAALAAGCLYLGFMLFSSLSGFWGILAGLGIVSVGVLVLFFLVKFLFAVNRSDMSSSVQITEEEQPVLFAFIRSVAADTQTPFPKKIFLSADVNASVSYNSSFWSMFLPVKKNLQIGLGLVNSISVSEFKAVLAHEFGHFSQRSMKLGSFVYQVNRIIYNMLYQNSGYALVLNGLGNLHGLLAIFTQITVAIVRSIQWILQQMYGLINRQYSSLSREMEFHADAVAASVGGSEALITALRRVEIADTAYGLTIEHCTRLLEQKKVSPNIYPNQKATLEDLAINYQLDMQHGLPVLTDAFLAGLKTMRINYKDQWASHPSREDREAHLRSLNITAENDPQPAWILFEQTSYWQEQLTQKIYASADCSGTHTIDASDFNEYLVAERNLYSLPPEYNGYYDGRQPEVPEESDTLYKPGTAAGQTAAALFAPEYASLPKKIVNLNAEIALLRQMAAGEIKVKSFDFDGTKYNQADASALADQLAKEEETVRQQLKAHDLHIVYFFIDLSTAKGESLEEAYRTYFAEARLAATYFDTLNKTLSSLQPIYTGQLQSTEAAEQLVNELRTLHEPVVKRKLQEWLDKGVFANDATVRGNVEKFIASTHHYFDGTEFFNNELVSLHQLSESSWQAVNQWLFVHLKQILEKQTRLFGETKNAAIAVV